MPLQMKQTAISVVRGQRTLRRLPNRQRPEPNTDG